MDIILNLFKWWYLGLITFVTIIPRYFIIGVLSIFDVNSANKLKIKGKPIIPVIVLSLTVSTYLVCIFIFSRWYVQKLKLDFLINDISVSSEQVKNDIEIVNDTLYEPNTSNDKYANISFINKDFADLLNQNNETVGWIVVNNTNVDYPVVQAKDNDYYLKHDFNKRNNRNGWVFADFRDDFKYFGTNTIIYAHNLTTRKMFGSLIWCLKDSWYTNEDNHYIKISTPTSNTVWKIFSIYTVVPETYYIRTYFPNDEDHQQFVDTLKGRSIYNFQEEVSINDKVLTLSTCTDDGRKRAVIHAKMIKIEYK